MERLTCKYDGDNVLREMCTFDRESDVEANDCVTCHEYCSHKDMNCEHCSIQKAFDKLAEYEQMEEKGLLKLLPVNVGDTVYTNFSMQGWYFRKKDRPYKAKVVFIGINNSDNFMNVVFENDNMLEFKFSEIGKRVFLTEEAAKRALEEQNNVK